jgi:hypothetical protein
MATVKFHLGDGAPLNNKASHSTEDLCFVCGRALGADPLYFEVNTSWELIARGSDEKNSQGCFPIGSSCANKFAEGIVFRF